MIREDEIERFLRRCPDDRPFRACHLALAVSDPAFDEVAAEGKLLRLLVQDRAYFRGGFWYSGRSRSSGARSLPPASLSPVSR